MNKVYVVLEEDGVRAVFSTEGDAEKYRKMHVYDEVQEWDVDEYVEETKAVLSTILTVSMNVKSFNGVMCDFTLGTNISGTYHPQLEDDRLFTRRHNEGYWEFDLRVERLFDEEVYGTKQDQLDAMKAVTMARVPHILALREDKKDIADIQSMFANRDV